MVPGSCLFILYSSFTIFSGVLSTVYRHYDEEFEMEDSERLNTQFYFAYGIDMVRERITDIVQNVTFRGPAVLKHFRLDFGGYNDIWNGAQATICPESEKEVWGVLWAMTKSDLKLISESKDPSKYQQLYVKVHTPSSRVEYLATTHAAKEIPKKMPPWMPLPKERRPSDTYLKTLLAGAVEAGLPINYVRNLYNIPSNKKQAKDPVRRSLQPRMLNAAFNNMHYNFDFELKLRR